MTHTHRKSVVFLVSLLLLAAQLASQVHAAEHHFHAEDETCAAFASFEKHDNAVAGLPPTNPHPQITCNADAGIASILVDNPSFIFRSRAPPLHT